MPCGSSTSRRPTTAMANGVGLWALQTSQRQQGPLGVPKPQAWRKAPRCRSGLATACCAVAKFCADQSGPHGFFFPLVSCSDGNCANLERVNRSHSIPEGVTLRVPPWPQILSPHPPGSEDGQESSSGQAWNTIYRIRPSLSFPEVITCLPERWKRL